VSCTQFTLEVGDYADGRLTEPSLARFEAHLPACAACRATVADFQAIRNAAAALERPLPSPQVWTRIAAAVEAGTAEQRPSRLRRLFGIGAAGLPWRQALAVATMLALLVSGTWLAWRQVVSGGAQRAATSEPASTAEALQSVETEMRLAEDHYTKAINSLEQITRSDDGSLDRQTAAVLQENLTVIDRAIGESRAALQKEPTSDLAQESLFDALRSKVSLLQDTVALINEMRKGNQEGAARIVSGLSQ
jgi:anti-sigma factor RsiW